MKGVDSPVRILIADDHPVVRDGLAAMLGTQPDFEIVGEASDGESAISLAEEVQPHVVLMDINMPSVNGIQATRIIHKRFPQICIIGLSMFEKGEQEKDMREAGALYYLNKSGPSDVLIQTIRNCVKDTSIQRIPAADGGGSSSDAAGSGS